MGRRVPTRGTPGVILGIPEGTGGRVRPLAEGLAPEALAPNLQVMNLLVILLVLALIFGGVGLFVTGLKWMLIISAFLFVASLFTGTTGRGRLGA